MTAAALVPVSGRTLAPRSPWEVLPPLGNLDAYISAVQRLPMLTADEEAECARQWRDHQDRDAAGKLVMSHLRLVVSVARQYLGYGLPHADLIQEGNIGLMKAVKRYDPSQGVRLVSYAMHWIKAEIHEYIVRNWRMVKVATTKAQRKLFFNLRSLKASLQAQRNDDTLGFEPMHRNEVDAMAQTLKVRPEDVVEMELRMSGGDVSIDPGNHDDDAYSPIQTLGDTRQEPSRLMESRQREHMASEGVAAALSELDERSRQIIAARWLHVNDEGSGGKTLHELAAEFGVSAERIRQIEANALKKMRKLLEAEPA
jgi:RNA polymerase sigma-32 factor